MTATYLGSYQKGQTPTCAALGVFYVLEHGWYVRAFNSEVGPFDKREDAEATYWHVINHGQGVEATMPQRMPMFTKIGLLVSLALILAGIFWHQIAEFFSGIVQ